MTTRESAALIDKSPAAADAIRDRHLIIFTLNGEEFGVDVDQVREILKIPRIHFLPRAADFVAGVVSFRKHIIAVVDMRKRLGITPAAYTDESRIIIVRIQNIVAGIAVDSVLEILSMPAGAMDPLPGPAASGIQDRYISSMLRIGDRIIMTLDMNEVLTSKDIGELLQTGRGRFDPERADILQEKNP